MQQQKANGFTIIELLVVIVVLGILAAISLVSYTGVQNRARATKTKTNAASVEKVAEAYYAQKNTYPTAVSHFRSGIITLPTEISLSTAINASNGETTVGYRYVGSATNATGACIYYWDFTPTTGSPRLSSVIRLGNATTANCTTTAGIAI